jgi:hypothetical protein
MPRAALLLLAIAGSAAHASDPQTRQVFNSYGQCVVQKHPRQAADVVLSQLSTREILKTHQELVDPDCLGSAGALIMPGSDFLRYGLAEALVRREYAAGLPADFAFAGPIQHFQPDEADYRPKPGKTLKPKEMAKLEERRKHEVALRTMSMYGECVARRSPSTALQLVLSKPTSPGEAAALAAMRGPLSDCLPPGMTVALDKAAVRGSVALNLYRLAHAPRVPPKRG